MLNDKDFDKRFYYEQVIDFQTFTSYNYQLSTIKKLNPTSILEVGTGGKVIFNILKECGYDIKSCDFNKKLNPDVLGDIRMLPCKNNSFDVVCAFEVLEHIPFGDVESAIHEMHRITKQYVVISVPYPGICLEWIFKSNLLKNSKRIIFKIPFFLQSHNKTGNTHQWELGRRTTTKKQFESKIMEMFDIVHQFSPYLNDYHHFYVLKKKIFV